MTGRGRDLSHHLGNRLLRRRGPPCPPPSADVPLVDFLDIMHLVTSQLTSPAECWRLWTRKNPEYAVESGKAKVLFHLASLDRRRPLDGILDPKERDQAQHTRDWFRREFVGQVS